MAASLYGITVDNLDFAVGDPKSFIVACARIARGTLHAPTALVMRASAALREALSA